MRLDVGVGGLYHARGEIGNAYKISIKKTVKERACMEHIGIYRRIIL